MTENEKPINGQGLRLVQQSEGINLPLLQPWEVDGEKELIKDPNTLELVKAFEADLSVLYDHTQECKDPDCNVKSVFDEVMDFRRRYCFSLLKEENYTMYEVTFSLIYLYRMARGNKNKFQSAILLGQALSAKMLTEK